MRAPLPPRPAHLAPLPHQPALAVTWPRPTIPGGGGYGGGGHGGGGGCDPPLKPAQVARVDPLAPRAPCFLLLAAPPCRHQDLLNFQKNAFRHLRRVLQS